jgi:hypothetical protein
MNFYPVITHWQEIFKERFKDETTDALKMKVVDKMPFQDDPTRVAPYITIGLDERRLEAGISVPEEPIEIGGPARWKVYLRIRAAPKVAKSADLAYYYVDLLTHRIVYTLREKALLRAAGQGNIILANRDWNFINGISPKVYGGDREWLSYVDIYWTQQVKETGSYPYGEYPGDLDVTGI